MPLSYKNIINSQLSNALAQGDFSLNGVLKKPSVTAKYIKGYAKEDAIQALSKLVGLDSALFKQIFGIEDKKLDAYDPYHTSDSKTEDFWNQDGKEIQSNVDDDTNTFKRSLYSQFGFRDMDFWYEDPFIPSFELFFDEESPLFNNNGDSVLSSNFTSTQPAGFDTITGFPLPIVNTISRYKSSLNINGTSNSVGAPANKIIQNSIFNFMRNQYQQIDNMGYSQRITLWREFRNIFFKIFETDLHKNKIRNIKNKAYYITKISGLQNLNKKFIKYGPPDGDKITITLNEDVSMIAWYLAELYKNIIYSYKNQRYTVPENLMRFDMTIKINEMRNYQVPTNDAKGYEISPKSEILYTLHDCTFDFFESKNYGDDLEIGGYGGGPTYSPQSLSFNIYFKSVTHYSEFPLINNALSITPWGTNLYNDPGEIGEDGTKQSLNDNLNRIYQSGSTTPQSFLNSLLGKAAQTIVNTAANYADSLETKLRSVRGSAVNSLLSQMNTLTGINKIEPDNVYSANFNNRTSLSNLGSSLASGLLTDLQDVLRNAANF